jgi:hypothetical protein
MTQTAYESILRTSVESAHLPYYYANWDLDCEAVEALRGPRRLFVFLAQHNNRLAAFINCMNQGVCFGWKRWHRLKHTENETALEIAQLVYMVGPRFELSVLVSGKLGDKDITLYCHGAKVAAIHGTCRL